MSRFLQIHWLASYPAALLNRDDAGLAKRIPFGGHTRGRISSQCLKRRWRLGGEDSLDSAVRNPWALQNIGVPTGYRSKEIVERLILKRACEDLTVDDDVVQAVCNSLVKELYGDKGESSRNRQALFFGEPEVNYLARKAREALKIKDPKEAASTMTKMLKEERANLKTLVHGAGLEAALFGRMVTSDPSANTDAPIHVAHAFTVHPLERELDFMAVVDDLKVRSEGDDSGAAGVFDMELSSGLYYGYTVVDVPLLVSNLNADSSVARKVVEHLVHLIAEVSPGAKKGSTAPYAYAEWMMIESGKRQPRTLANAYRDPLQGSSISMERAVERLGTHLAKMDAAYGAAEIRMQMGVEHVVPEIPRKSLPELAAWAASQIEAAA